ncbi:hypothetical protein D0962_19530 [Leptolyngbyaceae cyanobacterium CCMR0082]|uniref:Uncharacterized protein n=2 Tax=Adonisia turfae TaxID=2950184 RepID=A0A6M0SAD5_9CYAN|nr:hypothetical protein [Adonisia turfae]NEZ59857.1 hypothetical protein [Adonisia turfae CCMR0081]NEZ64951.1 hypothetical protein [Adonisia turfae CCMR0082]
MVKKSRSTANWTAISQGFGLASSVNSANGETTSTIVEEPAVTNTTPILLSSFLNYGQLSVVANANEGELFTNPTDFKVKVTFVPDVKGTWSVEVPDELLPGELENPLSLTSLGQTVDPAESILVPSHVLKPTFPVGALLIKQAEHYEEVGEQTTISLDPKESVSLLCNYYSQSSDLYDLSATDSITVWWFLEVNRETPTNGRFKVEAASGYLFKNNFEHTLTFYFSAEGTWKIFAEGKSIDYVGYTSVYTEAFDSYLLPGSPAGCLLVGRGETIKIGDEDSGLGADELVPLKDQNAWSLEPGETILFVSNGNIEENFTKSDNGQNGGIDWIFNNHSDEITVKWAVVGAS